MLEAVVVVSSAGPCRHMARSHELGLRAVSSPQGSRGVSAWPLPFRTSHCEPVMRRDKATDEAEGMDDWDQAELEKAVAQKHGSDNTNRPTAIICKHFLDAVEKRQYGW